jgi:predicted secreted acid phosphatase
MQVRKSTIPGRRHKMVFVDFGNPYYRNHVKGFCKAHRAALDDIAAQLHDWSVQARRDEARLAVTEGRVPRELAAVLDIDEIVLSNIHMNTFQAPAGEQGPAPIDFHAADYFTAPDGKPWPRDDLRLNPLLPGARELLETLRDLGIRPFFITGRLESIRDETVENFEYVGLAAAGDPEESLDALFDLADLKKTDGSLIMCPDAEYPPAGQSIRPFKESRRRAIEATHRIVLNVGDQVSDLGLYGDIQVHVPHPYYWTA